jgi:hypothetical protein
MLGRHTLNLAPAIGVYEDSLERHFHARSTARFVRRLPRNPITGMAGCCARAESGQAAVVLARSVMNSRRCMSAPSLWTEHPNGSNKLSALPPKADIRQRSCDVRFVPKADIRRTVQPTRCLRPAW